MNCAQIEILICDYAEGTLGPAEAAEVERHLAGCTACAELARDSAAALSFIERAADVEPPPELITRILFDAPWSKSKNKSKYRVWVSALLSPIRQPKFAMGMALTVISLSMLAQFVVPVRQLRPEDLKPTAVWAAMEDRGVRAWGRTVKFYNNLKFVYQIQTTLREWQQQDEDRRTEPNGGESRPGDDRKLPVNSSPGSGPAATGGAPAAGRPADRN
jgi:Putative zinc-finger